MSNLGLYQWMTTSSKACGGPLKFLGLVAAGGYVTGKFIELGAGFTKKKVSEKINKNSTQKDKLYSVIKDGKSNEGVEFKIGDSIRVLDIDKDVVLIEKIGDDNNPYYVSMEFLSDITDYNESK